MGMHSTCYSVHAHGKTLQIPTTLHTFDLFLSSPLLVVSFKCLMKTSLMAAVSETTAADEADPGYTSY